MERDRETLIDECLIQIKDKEKRQCPKHQKSSSKGLEDKIRDTELRELGFIGSKRTGDAAGAGVRGDLKS